MELPEGPQMGGIHSEDTSTNSFVKIALHTQVEGFCTLCSDISLLNNL